MSRKLRARLPRFGMPCFGRLLPLPVLIACTLAAPNPAHAHVRKPAPTPEEIAWSRHAAVIRNALRGHREELPELPPAPEGVTDLAFSDFFAPIGPRGLEYSPKMAALAGRQVRIVGYMVRQQAPAPGLLLLTPRPVTTEEFEYGAADELPASTLHVFVPDLAGRTVPLTPGQLVLTGRLELGPRAEADGRNSVARLFLDPRPPAPAPAPVTAGTAAPTVPVAPAETSSTVGTASR